MSDTDKCLASVKARAAAATSGPWRLVNEIDPNPIFLNTWGPNYKTVFYIQAGYGFGEGGNSQTQSSLTNITPPHITHLSMADADFIAHARTDIERLVAMVEAAERGRREAVEAFDKLEKYARESYRMDRERARQNMPGAESYFRDAVWGADVWNNVLNYLGMLSGKLQIAREVPAELDRLAAGGRE